MRMRRYYWYLAAQPVVGSSGGYAWFLMAAPTASKICQFGCRFLTRDCILPHCLEQLTCNARDVKPQLACYAASGLFLNQKRQLQFKGQTDGLSLAFVQVLGFALEILCCPGFGALFNDHENRVSRGDDPRRDAEGRRSCPLYVATMVTPSTDVKLNVVKHLNAMWWGALLLGVHGVG